MKIDMVQEVVQWGTGNRNKKTGRSRTIMEVLMVRMTRMRGKDKPVNVKSGCGKGGRGQAVT